MNETSEPKAPADVETRAPLVLPPALTRDEVRAYEALRTDAVWFESAGKWSSFRGPKAAEALNGLVTNDVVLLKPGEGQYAAALTPKGKIMADMLIIREDDETFLLSMLPAVSESWLALARKYVNPRLAKVADETDRYATWMVYGAQAPKAVARLGSVGTTAATLGDVMVSALAAWPVWHHGPWNLGPAAVRLIRAPLLGSLPGFIVVADAADADVVRDRLESSQSQRGTRNVWDVARVEAGRPVFGIDMDENTLPQEANLDTIGAISFEKGCYTGQETVARIHFRGHVNKSLRGLLGSAVLPQGAAVLDETGKTVGDVRSTVASPRLGSIAIAMVRREVKDGQTVLIESDSGAFAARVSSLPFPGGA